MTHRQTQTLEHQRQAGPGGGRQRRNAAERGADDHVDRGQLILRLQQAAAQLLQPRRQPLQQVTGRCDRVRCREADAMMRRL